MPATHETYVALLRGINVGGANKIPMARLRSTAVGIGCEGVRTWIQSGNLVCKANMSAEALAKRLETAITREFGFTIPVIVRSASVWKRYVKGNPFPGEARTQAKWVLLCLSRIPPATTAASELQQRATQGGRVVPEGDAIWIHYPRGIARSKLSPTMLDRHMESAVTTRNWRTVLKLDEMARESAAV